MDEFDDLNLDFSLDDIKSDSSEEKDNDIAIIGISAKIPMGDNIHEFWKNIKNGCNFIEDFPKERKKDIDNYLNFKENSKDEYKYFKGAYLKDIDKFDYKYFNMTPKEAELMDPCQRVFLENTIKAIEDAGYGGDKLKKTDTGVFIGYGGNIKDSYQNMIWNVEPESVPLSFVGNMNGVMGSRISYLLDLRGPSVLIDTTCASSLVAVHSACQALLNGECSMAIAGSIRINLLPKDDDVCRMGVESKDYETRTFDSNGDGFGVGEGVVSIILKPLKRAIYDNDSIYAVIKGSAVNQGGNSMALTATNPEAQTDVIKKVWNNADIDPESIELIEAHGTATNLGDPIEIKGVTDAFKKFTDKKGFCAIGSIKSNLGHLYEASGIVGLLKVVLAIRNKTIPATLNFNKPNSEIDFINSPVYVNTKSKYWDTVWDKRRAAINSFGLNGANSHMVIEEYDEEIEIAEDKESLILVLSAKSENSLKNLCKEYIRFLEKEKVNLTNMCYTAAVGRWHHNHRLVIKFNDKEQLIKELGKIINKPLSDVNDRNIQYVELNKNFQANPLKNLESYSEEEIYKKYLQGYKINWEEVYSHLECRLIHIPSYEFDKERCWIHIPESSEEEFAYNLKWVEKEQDIKDFKDKQKIILISTSLEEIKQYEEVLNNENCFKVLLGNNYRIIEEDFIEVSGDNEDFFRLGQVLENNNFRKAIYVADNSIFSHTKTVEELDISLNKGFFTLFNLYRTIKLDELSLVVSNLNYISGEEEFISKEAAPIVALLKIIEKEDKGISIKVIDKDLETTPLEVLIELSNREDRYVALRNKSRYVQVFTKLNPSKKDDIELKSEGCYLVTGGTGSISLQLCSALSKKEKITFVLLNRRKFIERSKWDSIISENKDRKLIDKLNILKDIEKTGSKIVFKAVDICEYESMKVLIEDVENTIGRINGVVHCAGVGDYGLVKETNIDDIKKVINPKIKGTFIIDNLIKHKLDFYILLSSVASIFPSTMQLAYCAGNMYLDNFTDYLMCRGQKVLRINWTTWKEIGMAKDKEMVADLIFNALTTEKAVSFFERILKDNSISRVLLGELNRTKLGLNIIKNSGVTFDKNIKLDIEEKTIKTEKINVKTNDVEVVGKTNEEYTNIEKEIAGICKDVLGYNTVNIYENFFGMGADSLQIMNIHKKISKIYPDKVDVTDMFSYSNVSRLAAFIAEKSEDKKVKRISVDKEKINTDEGFAIIGVAANLPKVKNLEEFYEFIKERQCAVSELPKWRKEFLKKYLRFKNSKVDDYKFSTGSYLDDIDKFDYKFFNISPREAALTDPHQRLFLETALTAIEDAGYGGGKLSHTKTGVFLGFASNIRDMYSRIVYEINEKNSGDAIVGNTQAVAAGRISYYLNLKGASMVIDTACSSSIVAIDTAINYLKSGSISMALVGGIKLNLVSIYSEGEVNGIGMESSDGITRSFDNTSDGTAFGEGVEAILLKPLSKALEDGDHIYGTIKGIAVNQDGNTASITAPNPESQKDVILEAWENANINPEDISYVEAHGTGTQLGDKIEFKSLTDAFKEYTDKKAFCAFGTVKTNYGHLSEGSGLVGVMKGIMSLKHESIPPIINFINPNSKIDMTKSALYMSVKNVRWPKTDKPRIFALSNFGMSGTNAHVVIEEYIDDRKINKKNEEQILTISNMTHEGLIESIKEFINYLEKNEDVNLESLAYTVNTGRGHYEYRLAIIEKDVLNIIEKLKEFLANKKDIKDLYYGRNKVIFEDKERKENFELHENDKRELTEKAKKIVNGNLDLKEISRLYSKGADIDWKDIYKDKEILKISAPTYKFAKTRSWIEIPKNYVLDREGIYYTTRWIESEIEHNKLKDSSVYLIFYNEVNNLNNKIIEKLEENNTVIKITLTEMQERLNSLNDYVSLLQELKDKKINHIINMIQVGEVRDESIIHEFGLNSLFYIAKALVEVNYTNKIKLTILTSNVWNVNGEEKFNPLISEAIGINRVIGLEIPNVMCKAIDVDLDTKEEEIINELVYETTNYMICYRNNLRYVEEFIQKDIEEDKNNNYEIKDNGVYVFTGGTGGIALVLAKSLAKKNNKVKIALLNRSNLIDDGSQDKKNKIKTIEEMKAMGAEVSLYKVDVNDSIKMKEVFTNLKEKYGKINGVVHAAGVASAEILATKTKESLDEVMNPKVSGTINILNEIKSEKVDFLVVCGSASTLTGEASEADYVAANTFLNAFAYYANSIGVKTHCINWVSWKTEGMAVRYGINVDTIFKALENKDAIEGFYNIINSTIERIFIGKLNFNYFKDKNIDVKKLPFDVENRIKEEIKCESSESVELEFIPMKSKKDEYKLEENEMKLTGKDESGESYNQVEIEVANIFMKVLGYKSIDIYDNFFELGGDSILLGRVHALLEEKYPGKLKLLDLFKYTTVYKIAKFLTEGDSSEEELIDLEENNEELELENMLKELENGDLSVEEMIDRLN